MNVLQVLEAIFVPLLERELKNDTARDSGHEATHSTPVLSSLRRLTGIVRHAVEQFSGNQSPSTSHDEKCHYAMHIGWVEVLSSAIFSR